MKSVERTDQTLVGLFLEGDQEAFDELVMRHKSVAFNMAYQFLHNHEDAMEVAQDAFVKAYFALPKFRGDSEFRTWLLSIVRNLMLNRLRALKSRRVDKTVSLQDDREGEGTALEDRLPAQSNTTREVLHNERSRLILKAVNRLPVRFREAVILRDIQGLTYEEAAAVVSCEMGTLKSRLARAREELRALLQVEGVSYE